MSATFANFPTPTGVRGLAALATASTVTLLATTTETVVNRVVLFVDDGVTTNPVGTVIATAGTSMVYRGVALGAQ